MLNIRFENRLHNMDPRSKNKRLFFPIFFHHFWNNDNRLEMLITLERFITEHVSFRRSSFEGNPLVEDSLIYSNDSGNSLHYLKQWVDLGEARKQVTLGEYFAAYGREKLPDWDLPLTGAELYHEIHRHSAQVASYALLKYMFTRGVTSENIFYLFWNKFNKEIRSDPDLLGTREGEEGNNEENFVEILKRNGTILSQEMETEFVVIRRELEELCENEIRFEDLGEDIKVPDLIREMENLSDKEFFYFLADKKIFQ